MLETKIKVLLSTIPVGLLGVLLILMVQSAPVPALAQSDQETVSEEAVRQAGQTQQQNETGGAPATAPAAPAAAPAAPAPPSSAEQQNQTEAAPAPAAQQEQQAQDYDANLTGSM